MSAITRCPICFQCKDISKFLFHRCDEKRPDCAICRERKQHPPHHIFVKFEDPDASQSVDVSQLSDAIDTRGDVLTSYSLAHVGRRIQDAANGAGGTTDAGEPAEGSVRPMATRLPVMQDLEAAQEMAARLEARNCELEVALATERAARRAAEQRAAQYQVAFEDSRHEVEQARAKNDRLVRRIEKLEEETREQAKGMRAKDSELVAMGSELSLTKKKMRGMTRQSKKQSSSSKADEDNSLVVL
ncbi:hypothetical protein BD626DRAFT_550939 [Schizophyllum amplum]|uniref:Uncharacterized protein n=1 Tax=Schizophyllum amplum TaxID=97359 RepID=A0A550BZ41_9AGAR|nr:hypothetical protein BD626DRAFT_550939 [Auriculariopsis ampla]